MPKPNYYVVNGAKLKCTLCLNPTKTAKLQNVGGNASDTGKTKATIFDSTPMHIAPPFFSKCKIPLPGVGIQCIFVPVSPWIDTVNHSQKRAGRPTITDAAKLVCIRGGVITIKNAGQNTEQVKSYDKECNECGKKRAAHNIDLGLQGCHSGKSTILGQNIMMKYYVDEKIKNNMGTMINKNFVDQLITGSVDTLAQAKSMSRANMSKLSDMIPMLFNSAAQCPPLITTKVEEHPLDSRAHLDGDGNWLNSPNQSEPMYDFHPKGSRKRVDRTTRPFKIHKWRKHRKAEAHHLIPCEVMEWEEEGETVSDDDWEYICEFYGYDINHHKNGVFLPSFPQIACDLKIPLHFGNHLRSLNFNTPEPYTDSCERYLRKIKEDALECKNNDQDLIKKMNKVSQKIWKRVKKFNLTLTDGGREYDEGGDGCLGSNKLNVRSSYGQLKRMRNKGKYPCRSGTYVLKNSSEQTGFSEHGFKARIKSHEYFKERPGTF